MLRRSRWTCNTDEHCLLDLEAEVGRRSGPPAPRRLSSDSKCKRSDVDLCIVSVKVGGFLFYTWCTQKTGSRFEQIQLLGFLAERLCSARQGCGGNIPSASALGGGPLIQAAGEGPVSPRDRMGESSARHREQEASGRPLFTLAAPTPLLIDLLSERSVNTAEQTCNGTINQRTALRTTLCQEHARACVNIYMIGRCHMFSHSVALECTRRGIWGNRSGKQENKSLENKKQTIDKSPITYCTLIRDLLQLLSGSVCRNPVQTFLQTSASSRSITQKYYTTQCCRKNLKELHSLIVVQACCRLQQNRCYIQNKLNRKMCSRHPHVKVTC